MNTLLNKMIVPTLALTVLITAGSDNTHAQWGKSFRSKLQGRSSNNNNSGGNGSTFGNQTFNLQNTNILQGNSNRRLGQQNNNGNNLFNNGLGNTNLGNNSNRFRGVNINNGTLQNVLQNQNNGLNKNRLQNLNNNNRLKQLGNNGLQNLLGNGNGTLNNNPVLKNLGNNNSENGNPFQNWINNQKNKGGNGSKLATMILNNQKKGNLCIDHDHWCHSKPKHCHWWYNYCKPIAYCDPHHHVHCHWNYVTCDYHAGGQVIKDCRWYLGLKGLLLPGQGVGIEEVAPGSPAAAVGLQPGMVITACNGIELVDETVLAQVIAHSGGVLRMDLRLNADGPPATCVVVMQRVASVNF